MINYYIFFSIAGLINMLLLFVIFFSKKTFNLYENKVYKVMIFVAIFSILIELAMVFFVPLIESVLYLKELVRNTTPKAELYFEPVNKNSAYLYETTGGILREGVGTIFGTTKEMAYIKLLLGCNFSLTGKDLQNFVDTEINGEFIIQP